MEAWAEFGEAGGEAGGAGNVAERLRAELHTMRTYRPEQIPPYAPPPLDAGSGLGMPQTTAGAEPQQAWQHRSVAEAAEAAESRLLTAATAAATEAGDGMSELLSMELDSLAQRLAALRHSPAELYGPGSDLYERYAPGRARPDGSAFEPRTQTLPTGARFKRGQPRSAGGRQKVPPAVRASATPWA